MEQQKISKSIDGTSDLVVWAPIRQGFIEAFENITFETRLKLTAEAFYKIRVSVREYEHIIPFADTVQRILTLLNFRIGIIDRDLFLVKPGEPGQPDITSRRYMYLAATFDGPLEPYMRLIWRPLGPFLDLLLCNCEDYTAASDSSFDSYLKWVRDHKIESAIFYSVTGLTVKDHLYLTKLEKLQRAVDDDGMIAGMTSDDPEDLAANVRSRPANQVESNRLAIEALTVLFTLANYYPPDCFDGRYLLRAASDLLQGWRQDQLPDIVEKVYKEPLAWFRTPRPPSEMPTPNDQPLDKSEVQKGLLSGHDQPNRPMTHGALLLLQLDEPVDPAQARKFLHLLEPNWEVSPSQGLAALYTNVSFDLALTFQGLERLRLSKELLASFPKEFRDGMSDRAPMIGDVQDNHPRRWPLPARYFPDYPRPQSLPPVELTEIDIAVQLRTRQLAEEHGSGFVAFSAHDHSREAYRELTERKQGIVQSLNEIFGAAAEDDQDRKLNLTTPFDFLKPEKDPNPLATLIGLVAALGPEYGVRLVAVEDMVRGRETMVSRSDVVSSDPLAPPTTEHFGFRDGLSQPVIAKDEAAPALNEIRVGDLICGYRNSREDYPAGKDSSFLRNSSFMVVRKLAQDVQGFEDLLNRYPALGREDLAARLVGRKRDGTPLINPAAGNNFDYTDDPKGKQCPLAAHIRLSNPRQGFQGRPAPRILRRGMSYGKRQKEDPSAQRGVMFIAYNSSIAEQYEVIQRWLNRGNSTSIASAQNDPLTGTAIEPGPQIFRCFIGNQVHRIELEKPLVRVEWGAYFFVPSRTALRQILEPSKPDRYSVTEGEKILNKIVTMSPEAQRREWKVLLEDFLTKDPSEKNQSPQLWAAIRAKGGILRIDSGIDYGDNDASSVSSIPADKRADKQKVVLVADADLIKAVLSNDCIYSVYEQRRRAIESFGDIYVTQDPHDPNGSYLKESRDTNKIIFEYSQKKQKDAYDRAYACAKEVLDQGKMVAGDQGFFEIELSREFFMPALGKLCTYWFDIPDPGGEIELGGWGWAPVNDGMKMDNTYRKPRCPGDFLAPSRFSFYPRPTERIQMYGKSHGRALRVASLKIMGQMIAHNDAYLKGEISKKMYDAIFTGSNPEAEMDLLARNLIGIMEGMLPPTEGILSGILYKWLDQKTLWRYQGALRHAAGKSPATFKQATEALCYAVEAAMCERPSPDLLYRTAKKEDTLGTVKIEIDDLIILVLVSATQAALANDKPDITPIFGGDRKSALQPKGEPAHACPAKDMVMASVLGILAALLESGRIQALPGSMIIRISDYVTPTS
jgi:Dyp-type peroxidase family